MMKKSLFILLIAMCAGYFMPKEVFADYHDELLVFENYDINYKFFLDGDIDYSKYTFTLYDKTKNIYFESTYDVDDNTFNFISEKNNDNFFPYYAYSTYCNLLYDENKANKSLPNYYPFSSINYSDSYNILNSILDYTAYSSFVPRDYLFTYGLEHYGSNVYFYIPLILENKELQLKKIVFASVYYNVGMCGYNHHYISINFVNNITDGISDYLIRIYDINSGDSNYNNLKNNIDFMRKTMLDYSDELWEELNNGPIASSEIYSNNKARTNYKYVNQRIGTGEKNVPEETLEDYASSLPVLSFKKENINDNNVNKEDNNKTDNIINKITNPKTWNNGIVILVISMIVVIGSSMLIIKKRSVKV